MPNTNIKVDPVIRGQMDVIKLQIAGRIQRPVNQSQALAILVKLGQNHMDELTKIAEEIL